MKVLGVLKHSNNGEFQPFLTEAYIKGVPEPGASLKLFYHAGTNVIIRKSFKKFSTFNRIIFFLEFHVSTTVTISIAQHTGK